MICVFFIFMSVTTVWGIKIASISSTVSFSIGK